jgi:hypothetical protein
MTRKALSLFIFLACSAAVSSAQAAFMYVFTDLNDVPTSSFETTVAGTVDVKVYLTADTQDDKDLLLTYGLGAASFEVAFDPSLADVLFPSDVDVNGEFDISIVTFGSGLVSFDLASLVGTTPAESTYLATLTYTGIAPGLSPLSASDTGSTYLNDDGPTQITPSAANGDILVTSANQPIPEPTSVMVFLGLLTTAGLGAGVRRIRRVAAGQT